MGIDVRLRARKVPALVLPPPLALDVDTGGRNSCEGETNILQGGLGLRWVKASERQTLVPSRRLVLDLAASGERTSIMRWLGGHLCPGLEGRVIGMDRLSPWSGGA